MGVELVLRRADAKDGTPPLVYAFEQERVLLGRSAGSDVRIPHRSVSLEHAVIRQQGARWVVEDRGSTNGTWVKGARIPHGRPKVVEPGDQVRMGAFVLELKAGLARQEPTSRERTAELAARMLREWFAPAGAGEHGKLVVTSGPDAGREFALPPAPAHVVVGRGEEASFQLTDADCSRAHVELHVAHDATVARDLGSKNGTFHGGAPFAERRLRHRDELTLGATTLRFEEGTALALERSLREPDESAAPLRAEGLGAANGGATPGTPATPSTPPPAEPASATLTASTPKHDGSAGGAGTEAAGDARRDTARDPESAGRRAPPRKYVPTVRGDWATYGLAALVLLLSLAGLFALLSSE